jgi:hypothetical protein
MAKRVVTFGTEWGCTREGEGRWIAKVERSGRSTMIGLRNTEAEAWKILNELSDERVAQSDRMIDKEEQERIRGERRIRDFLSKHTDKENDYVSERTKSITLRASG